MPELSLDVDISRNTLTTPSSESIIPYYLIIVNMLSKKSINIDIYSIIPPPITLSPSYRTTDCPLVMAR